MCNHICDNQANSAAERCNRIFTAYWESKNREINGDSITIELNQNLGNYERRNMGLEDVVFYLTLYSDENKKYRVTFDDSRFTRILLFENEVILSPDTNRFDEYPQYASVVCAYAEAISSSLNID